MTNKIEKELYKWDRQERQRWRRLFEERDAILNELREAIAEYGNKEIRKNKERKHENTTDFTRTVLSRR